MSLINDAENEFQMIPSHFPLLNETNHYAVVVIKGVDQATKYYMHCTNVM